MIIAIHQPNYLPWPGYFFKIFVADCFVFLDNVKIDIPGYTRRTKIRKSLSNLDYSWLTVHISSLSNHLQVNELYLKDSDWPEKHIRKLRNSYKHAPFGKEILSFLQERFIHIKEYIHLDQLNAFLIKEIAGFLNINTQYRFASKLAIPYNEYSNYRSAICDYLGADSYIRGTGEQKYATLDEWPEDRLVLINSDIYSKLTELKATFPQYVNGYSIIDFLAFIPKEHLVGLFKHYADELIQSGNSE